MAEEHPEPRTLVVVAATSLGYGRGVLRGIYRFAKLRPHYHVMPMPMESLPEMPRWSRFGFVVQAQTVELARQLAALDAAIVNVADNSAELPLPTIMTEHHTVGALAAEHFLARGFRRLAFFGPRDWYATLRAEGFFQRLSQALPQSPPTWATDEDDLSSWLTTQRLPVAVMAAHDSAAQHVVEIARRLRLRVPEQVAVVGVDNDELLCEASRVPLSSVAVDAVRIGFEAARLADQMLSGQRPPRPQPLLIPPLGVVTRQSSEVTAIDDELVAEAVAWMEAHLRQPQNIEQLLEQMPVSRRKLEKRFLSALGRTPAQELRRLRVERIKLLLDTTGLSLARVAGEVGLASASVLCQIFAREAQTTPGRYRQRGRLPE